MARPVKKKRLKILHRNEDSSMHVTKQDSPYFPLKVFLLVIGAVVVQTSAAPYLTVLGAKPDVAMVIVICLAMMRGPVWGATVGFATGLLIDIALFQTLGISSFLFTLAGYFSGRYAEGVDPDSWFPPVLIVFVCTAVVQVLHAMIMFLLGVEASAGFVLLRIVLPTAILNALLAAPIFVVSRWLLGGEKRTGLFSEQ
ncbi:MAG: rod shape-determining protein MreD [Actinobacteria bacterium]|nr:rod shape-determining protein MreD [Actinomycetota bacterium]